MEITAKLSWALVFSWYARGVHGALFTAAGDLPALRSMAIGFPSVNDDDLSDTFECTPCSARELYRQNSKLEPRVKNTTI